VTQLQLQCMSGMPRHESHHVSSDVKVTYNNMCGPHSRHDVRSSLHLTSWVKIKTQQKWHAQTKWRPSCASILRMAIVGDNSKCNRLKLLETVRTVRRMRTGLETNHCPTKSKTLRNISIIQYVNPTKYQKNLEFRHKCHEKHVYQLSTLLSFKQVQYMVDRRTERLTGARTLGLLAMRRRLGAHVACK